MTHPASHRVDAKVAGSPAASQEAVRVLFTDRNGPFFFFFHASNLQLLSPKGWLRTDSRGKGRGQERDRSLWPGVFESSGSSL